MSWFVVEINWVSQLEKQCLEYHNEKHLCHNYHNENIFCHNSIFPHVWQTLNVSSQLCTSVSV